MSKLSRLACSGGHVLERTQNLANSGKERLVGEPVSRFHCLGQAEVDNFRNRFPVVGVDDNVARLEIAMNDPFLVRMLHAGTNIEKQFEPLFDTNLVFVAATRQRLTFQQLHDEERSPIRRRPHVEHFGNVWMVHHRQSLTLSFEAEQDLLVIHPTLNELQRHASPHRLLLHGHPYLTHPAFAKPLKQLIGPDDGRSRCPPDR